MEILRDADGLATSISMTKPADMHQHLRRGNMTKLVAPMVRRRFASAVFMPNILPPITTARAAEEYRLEIIHAMYPNGELTETFDPLFGCGMTLYFTDTLDPHEVISARRLGAVGVKYYPPGLTTNSDSGVTDPASLWTPGTNAYQVLQALVECSGALLLHAADGLDASGDELDPYDQETHFISETLPRIIDAHPNLRISVEHLSTKQGAEFMMKNGGTFLGCSLTPQHLLLDRRDLFRRGFNRNRFWIPVLQPSEHKEALRYLAIQGLDFVWLGSDSAPHPLADKQAECCKGGVLTAHAGIELYIEAFEDMGALDERFESFASTHGPHFYGLPFSNERIKLVREEWIVQNFFHASDVGEDGRALDNVEVQPFRLGEKMRWKLV